MPKPLPEPKRKTVEKPKPAPTVINPRYKDATPEMVGRALLRSPAGGKFKPPKSG